MPSQGEKKFDLLSLLPIDPKFCPGKLCYKPDLLKCEDALDILGPSFWRQNTTESFNHLYVSPLVAERSEHIFLLLDLLFLEIPKWGLNPGLYPLLLLPFAKAEKGFDPG